MPIRLCPHRTLPPYSYVPGKFPHPLREERGHSFGRPEPPCREPTNKDWPSCETYLWGFDLFNRGYYWEAHETWEAVWHACGRAGAAADLVKGLIKLAAAGVKAREGTAGGVRRHLRRGAELLESAARSIATGKQLLGIEPGKLASRFRELADKNEELVNASDEPVVVVLPLEVYPAQSAAET